MFFDDRKFPHAFCRHKQRIAALLPASQRGPYGETLATGRLGTTADVSEVVGQPIRDHG